MKNDINGSIVIYKNRYKDVKKVIDSFFSSDRSSRLYLIDNSPDDNAKDWFDGNINVRYIKADNNGYGAGHNIALKDSIYEEKYHVVLNPDIVFEKNVLDKLAEYLDSNFAIGLAMPRIIYPNGDMQYLCKLLPTPFDWIGRRFIPFKSIIERRNFKFELRFTDYNNELNVPYLSGCFMFFRSTVLQEIGLFDEKIFMYGEDTDITRRIHKKYMTMYYPNVKIIHEHQKESHKNFKLLIVHIKAAIYYFNKWGWFFDKERKEINQLVLERYMKND